jgi:thioredoxin 1
MSELVAHISDADFTKTVAEGVTLVDFWAPWCGPCRMIAPILDELAGELKDKARIVKINVDENPVVAGQFGVMSIPTLLLFKNGQKVDQKVGGQAKPQLKAFIEQAL